MRAIERVQRSGVHRGRKVEWAHTAVSNLPVLLQMARLVWQMMCLRVLKGMRRVLMRRILRKGLMLLSVREVLLLLRLQMRSLLDVLEMLRWVRSMGWVVKIARGGDVTPWRRRRSRVRT